MLSHWTQLPCELCLIWAHDIVPASKLLYLWYGFSCYTDYTQNFHLYEPTLFWVRMAGNCVDFVVL